VTAAFGFLQCKQGLRIWRKS